MRTIGDGIWSVRGADFRLPGGARIPLSASILRLAGRSLLLYAPIAFDARSAAAIDAAGTVAHIVAPNLFHHVFIVDALARWPQATFHAPPALAGKRPDLPPAQPLRADDPQLGGAI